MENFDAKTFIESARKKGVPDAEIFKYLDAKKLVPKSAIVASKPVTSPVAEQPAQEKTGLIADAAKTLIIKPAVRFAQAIGTPIAKALGATEEGIQRAQDATYNVPFDQKGGTVNIEPQKALGEGGATQIFTDALKSASYLAPYGKIAGTAAKLTTPALGQAAGRIAGGVAAGSLGGYTTDVANNIDQNKKITGDVFKPGFATILGGLTGGVLEGGAALIDSVSAGAKAYGKELEEQTLKLTPAQRTKLGSKLDEITDFSIEKIPSGNPEQRLEYAKDLIDDYESNLQFFLDSVSSEGRASTSVKKDTLLRQLRAIKGAYKYERDADAIAGQIDSVINTLNKQYAGDLIPVNKLNIFKRSTYQNAYNKAGDKVLDYVEHDIGDAVRVAIERATKGGTIGGKDVGQFNREYGNLLQLTKLLKLSAGRPELNFFKRITSRVIGGLIGNAAGGIPGIVGGELLAEPIANTAFGTASKSALAKKLQGVKPTNIGSPLQKIPTVRNPLNAFRDK